MTKEYIYGFGRLSGPESKFEAFVARKNSKRARSLKKVAFEIHVSSLDPDYLIDEARSLMRDHVLGVGRERLMRLRSGNVRIGDVANHVDRQGSHYAIVLDFPGPEQCWALFFASSKFGDRYRQATFVNLVLRQTDEFVPRGNTFPEHRVIDLRLEFLGLRTLPKESR